MGDRGCPTVQGSSPTVREVRAWTVAPDPRTVGILRPPKQTSTSNPVSRRFGRLDGRIRELLKDAHRAARQARAGSGHAPTPRTRAVDGCARARTMPLHRPSTASRRSGMLSGRCGRLDGRRGPLGYGLQACPAGAHPVEVLESNRQHRQRDRQRTRLAPAGDEQRREHARGGREPGEGGDRSPPQPPKSGSRDTRSPRKRRYRQAPPPLPVAGPIAAKPPPDQSASG